MAHRLRPAGAEDRDVLLRVYTSTREEELRLVDWSDDQKAAFVRQQFEAQDTYYREHYDAATFDVIEVDAEPVGRLYVARWEDEIRIVDIALLPECRGRGRGATRSAPRRGGRGREAPEHPCRGEQPCAASLRTARLWSGRGARGARVDGGSSLAEDGLVLHPGLVRPDRDDEKLEDPELVVLEAVDPLRQQRAGWAPENDRKGHSPSASIARRNRAERDRDELQIEC